MYNILIVDDEPAVLEGLESAVNWDEYGLEIKGMVLNSSEALRIIDNVKIHILLTDIKMPEVNGIELIRKIKQKNLDIKIVILSGYDDFEYIKEALKLGVENYLLKPLNIEELSSTLLTTIDKIESNLYKYIHSMEDFNSFRENVLYRWVTNAIGNQEFLERAPLLDIDSRAHEFLVAAVKLLDFSTIKDVAIASFSVLNICTEHLSSLKNIIVPVIFRDISNDIIILFYGDLLSADKSLFMKLINECVEKINTYLQFKIFISIGSIESGYENVYKSYSAAKNLQNYCLILPPNSVITSSEIERDSLSRTEIVDINYDIFNNLITTKKKEECLQFIDGLFLRISRENTLKPTLVRDLALDIVYNISGAIKKTLKTLDDTPDELRNLFSHFDTIRTRSEFVEWLKSIVCKAVDCLIEREDKTSPFIQQVVKYVRSNYDKDISLKSLSCTFNVNTSYMGQLFKKETGEMFTNYINNIRIEIAKEMLINTNLKINEISEKVGYLNLSHFFRIFKKVTGIPPAEYKEMAANKNLIRKQN